jgi:hypothetical protein
MRLNTDLYGGDISGNNHRLNTLYLSIKKVIKNTDIKLGRQFIYSNSLANPMDGIRINTNLKCADLEVFGGILLSPNISFQLKSKNDGNIYGLSIHSDKIYDISLKLGYTRKDLKPGSYYSVFAGKNINTSAIAEENIYLNAARSFKMFDVYGFLEFGLKRNEEGFSMLKRSGDIKRAIFTGTIKPFENLTATVQYYYSQPRVYLNSIFAVFSQYENQEVSLSAVYRICPDAYVHLGCSKVYFDDISNNRVTAGGSYKCLSAFYHFNEDDITTLNGISAQVNKSLKGFDIYGNINYNKHDNRIIRDVQDIYSYSLGVRKKICKNLYFNLTGISLENKLMSKDFRIFGQIRYNIFHRLK